MHHGLGTRPSENSEKRVWEIGWAEVYHAPGMQVCS